MPQFGLMDSASKMGRAPEVSALFGEADEFQVSAADVLTMTYEIDISRGQHCVPKALHPSLPSYAQVIFRRHREGVWGPCVTAELRINARAATNYLAYVVGVFTDSERALQALRDRYGAPVRSAQIQFEKRYYSVMASVRVDGALVFDAEVRELLPINGKDVLFTPNLNLARVDGKPRLVHQEMEYTIRTAERGQSLLKCVDSQLWGDGEVRFAQPLPATFVTADVKYTAVRYLVDPDVPAMAGTTHLK